MISDTRKKAMFPHMAGPETQEVFDTLTPVDNRYDKALEVLNTHFAVKKNIPFERSVFHQARQKQGEPTEQFVTRLHKLASTREYGDQTNDQICDQVIATCFSSSLRKKCLTEPSLTLEKLLEIAQAMESAHHWSKEIESGSSKSTLFSETGQDEEYLNCLRWKQQQQPPAKPKIENILKSPGDDAEFQVISVMNVVSVRA